MGLASLYKANWFKYTKNLIIGVGAALVMLGALYKIQSWEMPIIPGFGRVDLLTVGLITEAILFSLLGILPPEKDYYWEKLYPGIENYNSNVGSITAGSMDAGSGAKPLDGEVVEGKLGGMLVELQSMSRSLDSLKALQEVDFTETSEQLKTMNNFYTRLNEAMVTLTETVDDTKEYKEQLSSLNRNLSSLNGVYGNVLNAFSGGIK